MFSYNLKVLRKRAGLTQVELARKLHVANGTIAMWETGKREPNFETIQKIAGILNVSIDDLIGEHRESLISPKKRGIKIPVLGRVVAGVPVEAVQDVIDYEEIDEEMAKTGEFFALQIKGDSMEPRIKSGDVVIVRNQWSGRRDSNSRHPPWQGGTLPLSYYRIIAIGAGEET